MRWSPVLCDCQLGTSDVGAKNLSESAAFRLTLSLTSLIRKAKELQQLQSWCPLMAQPLLQSRWAAAAEHSLRQLRPGKPGQPLPWSASDYQCRAMVWNPQSWSSDSQASQKRLRLESVPLKNVAIVLHGTSDLESNIQVSGMTIVPCLLQQQANEMYEMIMWIQSHGVYMKWLNKFIGIQIHMHEFKGLSDPALSGISEFIHEFLGICIQICTEHWQISSTNWKSRRI